LWPVAGTYFAEIKDMNKTIYFIRHAQCHPDEDTHHSLWPLSETGKNQARQLPSLLSQLGIEKIFSSPYLRCLETVKPFSQLSGVEVEIHQDLRERMISKGVPNSESWIKSWADLKYAEPECEDSLTAQARFVKAVDHVTYHSSQEVLAISSHGNIIALFLHYLDPTFSRSDAEKIRNPYVIKVEKINGKYAWSDQFKIHGLNEIATLHSATPNIK
jgi:2,3-bisphosphoglycerate-dependent phosphoglycerate mutase